MAAEENRELPWDDRTDQFISAIDDLMGAESQQGIRLRDLLLNPTDYFSKPGIAETVEGIEKSVDSYFNEMLSGLKDEVRDLDQRLANTDLSYTKINELISVKSVSAGAPYIRPDSVYINPDEREELIVEQYTDDLDSLIGKLSNTSNYVADISGEYKEHKMGSWLFSGSRDYVLTIKVPTNIIMDIEQSRLSIRDMLDTILESVKTQQGPAK